MAKKSNDTEERKAVLKWSKSQFKEQIETQIAHGEKLLEFEIPSQMIPSGYGRTVQKVYDEGKFEEFKIAKTQWETVTKEILSQAFDIPNNEYHAQFYNAGQIVAIFGHEDWPVEYKKEVKKKIASLQALLMQLQFIQSETQEQNIKPIKATPKKIFISHSSGDGEFATALVDLLVFMGFDAKKEIFCSSVPDCWVEDGEDFISVIKKHFDENELYVIYIHSPRFYERHITLNEMGAAWALQSEYSSFLTKDMSFGEMDAVVPNTKVAIKVDSPEAVARMNSWRKRILAWFGKDEKNDSLWEMHRNSFLKHVRDLSYPQKEVSVKASVIPQREEVHLSEKDEEILKQWVDSNSNEMYKAEYIGGGCIILGDTDYQYETAREEANWNDFFRRLLKMGFIESTGRGGDSARYILTAKAYKYFD